MSNNKKIIRENFRLAVFERDNWTCLGCGEKSDILDAHHICDRKEIPNGGYVVQNGISLCPLCHIKAEKYHISGKIDFEQGFHPDDLYKKIGSSYQQAVLFSLKLES